MLNVLLGQNFSPSQNTRKFNKTNSRIWLPHISFYLFFLDVKWTKVLLVPQKCEIIMELFSIAPCKVFALNILCIIFYIFFASFLHFFFLKFQCILKAMLFLEMISFPSLIAISFYSKNVIGWAIAIR